MSHAHAPPKRKAKSRTPENGSSGEQAARGAGSRATRGVVGTLVGLPIQKLSVSTPGDPLEKEADSVAQQIGSGQSAGPAAISSTRGGSAQLQTVGEEEVQRQEDEEDVQALVQRQGGAEEEVQRQEEEEVQRQEEEEVQRQEEEEVQRQEGEEDVQTLGSHSGRAAPRVTPKTAATISNPGPGSRIPPSVRSGIEPHLGAGLGGARVHTGSAAASAASSLGARAFTVGSDIFLNRSESMHDMTLMGHEATHVVQQGAASVHRHPYVARTPEDIQLLPDFITDRLAGYARHIPGYTLFTVIIGFNPLTGRDVERNAMNLVEGLMGLVPFGTYIFDKLTELGVIQDAFAFVERQLATFDLSLSRLERVIDEAWDDMEFVRLDPFDYNVGVLERHFGALVDDVKGFASAVVDKLIELIKDALIGVADGLLADNQAWALIKKILHYDPLKGEEVEASTVEILEDFLMLIGRETELEQMREKGTLQETADWLDTQVETFFSLLTDLGSLFAAAWDAIQPENLPDILTSLEAIAIRAGTFLQRVWDFALTVALEVLRLIKDALLGFLAGFAEEVPGFHLITVILGRNPFTGEAVPRTAVNIIRGFISLLPGGNQIFLQLEETGVVTAAGERIEGAIADLGISWESVVGIFTGIWDSLGIEDLIDPIGAFTRIRDQYGEPISRLFQFIRVVVEEIFKLILALMNFPTDILGRIITNAMQAFEDIKRDPIGFLVDMLEAVRLGFSNFFDNFLTHLVNGLVEWLFGGLREAGIEPPEDLSLGSILDVVLEVLGLSMDRIWEKLAERFGQETVDRIRGAVDELVGMWNFINDVRERGIAAIWEYIESQISNLWDMVLEAATTWIMGNVITRVTAKLLSMLDPTGIMAVVNSFIAFFNAVQSAIEYIREILEIVDSYVATLAAVAAGDVEPGAARMEGGLAAAIPVAIGFLANQVGLGNIGEKMQEIIEGVRGVVDQALDWLLDQLEALVGRVLNAIGLGGAREEEAEGGADVDVADHGAVVAQVIQQMEAVEAAGDYGAVRMAAHQRAIELERQWSDRLEEGIGLRIALDTPTSDEADSDVDFTVTIAPNDSSDRGALTAAAAPEKTDVHEVASGGAEAKPLTKDAPTHGTERTSNALGNAEIIALNATTNIWRRLHMVHFGLGGPNTSWNIVPGDQSANSNMVPTEHAAIGMLEGLPATKAMWYRTTIASYWSAPHDMFVKSFSTAYGEWDYVNDEEHTTDTADFDSSDPSLVATGAIDVNSAGRDLLAATSGGTVNTYMGGLIRDEVLTNGRFADQADMESRLSTMGRFGTSEIADIRSLFASGTYVI